MPRLRSTVCMIVLWLLTMLPTAQAQKPPLTLDDAFNAVDIRSVQISPDGRAVAIETARPDWAAQRFRSDLWLYRDENGGSLVQLTQSGHDSAPQWSPDGRWIAFVSDRERDVAQVYVISASGGEPFPVTFGGEEIHAFAWSADSLRLYFATRTPWTKAQKDADAEEWKDVVRFRESERGDTLFSVDVDSLPGENRAHISQREGLPADKLATAPYRVSQMATSPDGHLLAISTDSPSQRLETHEPYGIYVADLPAGTLRLAIHTQADVDEIHWAANSRHIFFVYWAGAPEGAFQTSQTRLYWVDAAGGTAVRWASRFAGSVAEPDVGGGAFAIMQNGTVFAAGQLSTEAQPYTESSPDAEFVKQPAWAGTYEMLSAARQSSRVAFVHSSLQRPPEVYLAESPERLEQAKPITAFNQFFTERELPQGKPYRWTADDGTLVEGLLIFPPGKFEAKHLPVFTRIHGGFSGWVGNHFQAVWRWYQWAALAATQGWLVFEPNFRGSTGYGDEFMSRKIPHPLSRPGKDTLEGVDALVKDGIADPDQLTVGGDSYGGSLTTWLLTQTTRFKAALIDSGAVEWVVGYWGNGLASIQEAYSLGGVPWETQANYDAEAAIWQIAKVTTPAQIFLGPEGAEEAQDVPEAYLLERALQTRGVPHSLLIFPGEGHELDKNPWHGKIIVREELKWLEKYGRKRR